MNKYNEYQNSQRTKPGMYLPKIIKNNKNKNTTQSEQFQNKISKSQKEAKSIPLTHKYMIAHFAGLVQALNKKWLG